MSLYQLHRCVWDHIRAGQVSGQGGKPFDVSQYDLTEDERKAFEGPDVGALYQLGLHPVLLNAFCRASGFSRNDYRQMLEPFAQTEERVPRWRR